MNLEALSDVRVIDLTWHIAGPFCTKLLADYGADVIKIERPGLGDPARSMGPFLNDEPHPEKSGLFLHLNTSKRGCTLDVKTEAGKRILAQLIEKADILVESFRPRVMRSLKLDYNKLEKINPKLVMVSISSFGQTGPYRDYKAPEMIVNGIGGEMYCTGVQDREPIMMGADVLLYEGGSAAAVATVGALLVARIQGIGQHADVAIAEAISLDRRSANLVAYQYCGDIAPRLAGLAAGYPHGPRPCKDSYFEVYGGRVYWPRIVAMLGSPDFLKDPKWDSPSAQSDPALKEEFEIFYLGWLMDRTKEECFAEARKYNVPAAFASNIADVLANEHWQQRCSWAEIEHSFVGKITLPGRPFLMTKTPWRLQRPAPLLGEHNLEVYGELGYSKQDLVKLREQGCL